MGSYTYGHLDCLWRNSIFSFRIHSKNRMIKEVRVEYSVSELMHIFELSLKNIHLNLLKTHLILTMFFWLQTFGTNGSNRNFHIRLKFLLL